MKKSLFLTAVMAVFFFAAQAQLLVAIPDDSTEVSGIATDIYEPTSAHLYIQQNTGSGTSISWRLVDFVAPSGWGVQMCDNNNCYDMLLNPGPYNSLSVADGDTMDMKFEFVSGGIDGSGTAHFVAYIDGDSANSSIDLHYKINIDAQITSVNEVAKSAIKLYPNPVQNSFVVSGLAQGNYSFEVFDMKGSLMTTYMKSVTSNAIEIGAENLTPGVYVLKVNDASGNVIATSQLIKAN
jgi:hypothetical protein